MLLRYDSGKRRASRFAGGQRVDGVSACLWTLDAFAREATLFAAIGFLIGGADDLALDGVYLWARLRSGLGRASSDRSLQNFPVPATAGRLAIFVAAWDEGAVIGRMLAHMLAVLDHPDFRVFVGTYPNDRATIAAVVDIAEGDARVRLVIGTAPGPTTKADNLNGLWRALLREEAANGARFKGIVLHDAEDVVPAGELRIIDALLDIHAAVQLPVLPLIDARSPLVSGHYLDEFAESHAKTLVARELLGASLPLAGVGCGIGRDWLDRVAASRGGLPFDPASLTEDYELGLTIAALGGSGTLAWVSETPGGRPVAVREYFPSSLNAATRQKARWMTGIALAGWDRIGWGRAADWREHWMRARDRRAPLAVVVLAAAYLALFATALSSAAHWFADTPAPAIDPAMRAVLGVNAGLLCWRLAMRALFTWRAYGGRQAALSFPRAFVANYISLMAARLAVARYIGLLRGGTLHWDKTRHAFPDDVEEAL